jgi:hypothetical protein
LELIRKRLAVAAAGRHYMWVVSWLTAVVIKAMLHGYALLYNWLTYAVRRRQEFEADAYAVAVVGARVTRNALIRVRELDWALREFRTGLLTPIETAGYAPADVVAAFQAVLADPGDAERTVESDLRECEGAWFYSHPSLVERLGRLGEQADVTPDGPGGRAADLAPWFRQRFAAIIRPEHDWPGRRVKEIPVAAWLDLAARLRAPIAAATDLLGAADKVLKQRIGRATVATVMELLAVDRGIELAAALIGARVRSATGRSQAAAQLAEALFVLLGDVMVMQGQARWRFNPDEASTLEVMHGPTVARLATLASDAVTMPRAAKRLRRRLVRMGVDLAVRPRRVAGTGGASWKPPVSGSRRGGVTVLRLRRAAVGFAGGLVLFVFGRPGR